MTGSWSAADSSRPSSGRTSAIVFPAGGRTGHHARTHPRRAEPGRTNQVLHLRHRRAGDGLQVHQAPHSRPGNNLREELQKLNEKRAAAAKSRRWRQARALHRRRCQCCCRIQAQDWPSFVARPLSPAIAETVIVEVTIAADAAPGDRELRLVTPSGLTNPRSSAWASCPSFSATAYPRRIPGTGNGPSAATARSTARARPWTSPCPR